MKHINVLWPKQLEAEYLHLCDEFYDTITDEEAENDSIFFAKQGAYINTHASHALKEWIEHVENIRNDFA